MLIIENQDNSTIDEQKEGSNPPVLPATDTQRFCLWVLSVF